MSLTDTHAHLDYRDFDNDRDQVIQRALENSVDKIITIGIGRDSITRAIQLAEKYSSVFAVVGVHPTDLDLLPLNNWPFLVEASKHPRVVGIGETGLDYYRLNGINDEQEKENQKEYFLKQLELSKQIDKPVVIHCRAAYEDTLKVLQQFGKFRTSPGVLHCFGGSQEMAESVFALDYAISVGGILTFKNADELRQIVQRMPRDRLLLETDCPFLAPVPHRGKRNEPAYTRLAAEKVAELWNLSLDETLNQIALNVKRVFGI